MGWNSQVYFWSSSPTTHGRDISPNFHMDKDHELATRPSHVYQSQPSTAIPIRRSKQTPCHLYLFFVLYIDPPSTTLFPPFLLCFRLCFCFHLSTKMTMFPKLVSGFSNRAVAVHGGALKPNFSSVNSVPFSVSVVRRKQSNVSVICASIGGANNAAALTGVVFEPFKEVKKEVLGIPVAPQMSMARQNYASECEAAINEQINVEYNVSYIYHALFAYFDRDNIALKGLAKFFKESSEEEREHAEKFIEYQNKRGGKVKLYSIMMPPSEFDHAEKGDALYAMELALSLEKLTNEKLLNLHCVADKNNDPQLADFVESEFLTEQVEAIKKISEFVAQLRRVGKGHGVWHFDQMLLRDGAV